MTEKVYGKGIKPKFPGLEPKTYKEIGRKLSYNDSRRYDEKKKDAIATVSDNGRCWWIEQYLRYALWVIRWCNV